MNYNEFKALISMLAQNNINLTKEELDSIFAIPYFNHKDMNILQFILTDDSIKNKKKFIDMIKFVKESRYENMYSTFEEILKNPNIIKNNYYLTILLNTNSVYARKNLIRALQNPLVFNDEKLFDFINSLEEGMIQKRVVVCLEYELGIRSLDRIQKASSAYLKEILSEVEHDIIEDEKAKLNTITKRYLNDPTCENLENLRQYQEFLSTMAGDEISFKVSSVVPYKQKVLVFTKNESYTSYKNDDFDCLG